MTTVADIDLAQSQDSAAVQSLVSAQASLSSAQAAYYNAVDLQNRASADLSAAQVAYNNAQSGLSSASDLLAVATANLKASQNAVAVAGAALNAATLAAAQASNNLQAAQNAASSALVALNSALQRQSQAIAQVQAAQSALSAAQAQLQYLKANPPYWYVGSMGEVGYDGDGNYVGNVDPNYVIKTNYEASIAAQQTVVITAQNNLQSVIVAKSATDATVGAAQSAYNAAQLNVNPATSAKSSADANVAAAQATYNQAQSSLQTAQSGYNNATTQSGSVSGALSIAQSNLQSAQARKSQTDAQILTAAQALNSAQSSVQVAQSAKTQADTQLANLQATYRQEQSAQAAAQQAAQQAAAATAAAATAQAAAALPPSSSLRPGYDGDGNYVGGDVASVPVGNSAWAVAHNVGPLELKIGAGIAISQREMDFLEGHNGYGRGSSIAPSGWVAGVTPGNQQAIWNDFVARIQDYESAPDFLGINGLGGPDDWGPAVVVLAAVTAGVSEYMATAAQAAEMTAADTAGGLIADYGTTAAYDAAVGSTYSLTEIPTVTEIVTSAPIPSNTTTQTIATYEPATVDVIAPAPPSVPADIVTTADTSPTVDFSSSAPPLPQYEPAPIETIVPTVKDIAEQMPLPSSEPAPAPEPSAPADIVTTADTSPTVDFGNGTSSWIDNLKLPAISDPASLLKYAAPIVKAITGSGSKPGASPVTRSVVSDGSIVDSVTTGGAGLPLALAFAAFAIMPRRKGKHAR